MFKDRINKTLSLISDFLYEVAFKKRYYLPLLFITFISYAFSIFNRTVSIDDLAQDLYYGAGDLKIKGLRWGQVLINRIFSTISFTPFLNRFLGVIFLLITVVLICSILYYLDNKKNKMFKYTVFSCIFVSYPLINEFFEYYEALTIPLEFAIVSLCILYLLANEKYDIKNILLTGLVMSVIMAGYESLIFVYILMVFIILYHQYVINEDKKGWIKEGFGYALPLFIALVLKFVIGYGLLFITGLEYEMDGASSIGWFNGDIKESIIYTLFNGWYYFLRMFAYKPIMVFVLALFVYIGIVIRYQFKSRKSLIIGILLFVVVFALGILQGTKMPYRMAQTVHLFTAYSFFLLLNEISRKKLGTILCVLLMFMSYRQAVYLHELLALNNQRSDNEAALIQNIGYRLYSEFDISKTVIFCGEYNIGSYIESQICIEDNTLAGKVEEGVRKILGHNERPFYNEYVQSDVSSVLNWGLKSFDGQVMIKRYLAYCGYDIKVLEDWPDKDGESELKLIRHYTDIAEANDMKPYSIKEFDDYILVYFGPIIEDIGE